MDEATGEKLRRVLLVDDAQDVHDLIRIWLMEEAVELEHCFNGPAGISAAKMHSPDLILLDVDMPGDDGFAVCRQLKQDPATTAIQIIFLTGAASSDEKLLGLELGAVDYITKPFDPAELRARVRAALRTRQLMDLLEQRAMAVQQSEEEYRATFELASVGKAQIDAITGRFLRVNQKFCRITGYSEERLRASTFFSILHVSDRPGAGGLERLLHGETPDQTIEQRCMRPDGQTVWVEVSAAPIRDAAGNPARVVCVVQDITARKRAETLEELQREVLQMIAAGQPISDALRHLVGAAATHCDSMLPALLTLQDGRFRLTEKLGDWTVYAERLEEASVTFAADLLSRVSTPGSVVAARGDDAAWSVLGDHLPQPRIFWFKSVQAASGDLLGFLLLIGDVERLPTPFERDLIQTISRLSTIAIEHRQMADQMTYRAQHDALTGLPNRLLFEDRLQQAISSAQREGTMAALIYADLDRFKLINDTLGHHAGDELLGAVCRRWAQCLRGHDTLARLGGDEFALILPRLKAIDDAASVAQRLLEVLEEPIHIAGQDVVATSSLGISVFPHDGTDSATLQQSADGAMYRTKRSGRNGFRCSAPEVNAAAAERLELETQLRGAADRGELELHFQPVVDSSRWIMGLEALLRWNSPLLGSVTPARFIPIAEESGLIVPVGRWAIQEACRQIRRWLDAGIEVPPVAVNASALQFVRPDFVGMVEAAITEARLSSDRLVLEITETVLMQGREDLSERLLQLRRKGVRIAIDDFGTGYSSLSYLRRLPIDTLKVDRSFVADLAGDNAAPSTVAGDPADRNGEAIVGAIISMAHKLKLKVVAEGVESRDQWDFLISSGCDGIQGFLTGRPVGVGETEAILLKQARHLKVIAA